MTYLLDTDICVFWLRGHLSVRDRFLQVGPEAVSISIITLAELLYGAAVSSQPDVNRESIDQFITDIHVIEVSPTIAALFGTIKSDLRKQGNLLEDFDLLIAATARNQNLTLVTNNVNHFRRIDDLRLENWT